MGNEKLGMFRVCGWWEREQTWKEAMVSHHPLVLLIARAVSQGLPRTPLFWCKHTEPNCSKNRASKAHTQVSCLCGEHFLTEHVPTP